MFKLRLKFQKDLPAIKSDYSDVHFQELLRTANKIIVTYAGKLKTID